MPDVILSQTADLDLLRIWFDLDPKSPQVAERILRELHQVTMSLAALPERGAPRGDLAPQLRMLVHRRYLVFYRYDQPLDEVRIIRIIEGERDLTDLF